MTIMIDAPVFRMAPANDVGLNDRLRQIFAIVAVGAERHRRLVAAYRRATDL